MSAVRFSISNFSEASSWRENPASSPELLSFEGLGSDYRTILEQAFDDHGLDAIALPHMLSQTPGYSEGATEASTVGAINFLGAPGAIVEFVTFV